jgi:hypothetical protein
MEAEGMVRGKFEKLIFDEGRDPVRIPPINLPGKSNEGHEALLILYFFNPDFPSCHPDSPLSTYFINWRAFTLPVSPFVIPYNHF